MFLSDKTMRLLIDSGLPSDKLVEILQSLRHDEEASTPVRSNAAERQRRYRGRHKASQSVTEHNASVTDHNESVTVVTETGPEQQKVSPEPPSKTTSTIPLSPPKGGTFPLPHAKPALAKPSGFARFWEAYPRKVGRRVAEIAYDRAVKRLDGDDPPGVILAGLTRCKRSKSWQCEPEFLPHATTWLNRDGWDDEPDGSKLAQAPIALTPELHAQHLRHYADTGEWREAWGPRPAEVGPVVPFPRAEERRA